MSLAAGVVALIRDEIGPDSDFANDSPHTAGTQLDSLENIYTDTNRGNYSPLRTALICWRLRLNSLQARSFDATTGGDLMLRSQRARFITLRIRELEQLVDTTLRGRNMAVASTYDDEDSSTELSA